MLCGPPKALSICSGGRHAGWWLQPSSCCCICSIMGMTPCSTPLRLCVGRSPAMCTCTTSPALQAFHPMSAHQRCALQPATSRYCSTSYITTLPGTLLTKSVVAGVLTWMVCAAAVRTEMAALCMTSPGRGAQACTVTTSHAHGFLTLPQLQHWHPGHVKSTCVNTCTLMHPTLMK